MSIFVVTNMEITFISSHQQSSSTTSAGEPPRFTDIPDLILRTLVGNVCFELPPVQLGKLTGVQTAAGLPGSARGNASLVGLLLLLTGISEESCSGRGIIARVRG